MHWSRRTWSRRRLVLAGIVVPATLLFFATFASAAFAGNFYATGHDQDFHCAGGDTNECAYYQITTTFVRAGSTLPILILDRDSLQAVSALNLAYSNNASSSPSASSPPYVVEDPQGIQPTQINGTPPPGIGTSSTWGTTPLVDSSGAPLWSAIIVASDSSCGGCDLNKGGTHLDSDAINARTGDITTYFNAGGGLLYLAGADNAFNADGVSGKDVYYASVPVPVGGAPVTPPFTVTPDGATLGISGAMVNCCATHNSFALPDPSSVLKVAETDSAGLAESVFATTAAVCTSGFCAPDQSITAAGASGFNATEGAAAIGTVATFTDPDTAATASEYSATINWGDGNTSAGTVSGSGGSFTVSGTNTYAEEGSNTATVTITDTTNAANTATATTPVTVADAALHASNGTASVSGTVLSGTVATFTDDDPAGTVSDYTASVSWGDGATSAGTVTAASGHFAVGASHGYSHTGTFTVTVTIKDAGGSQATTTFTVTVTGKPKPKPKPKGSGRAKLTGTPSACVVAPVSLHVKGKQIASVKWFVGGSRVKGRTVHRGTSYSTRFSLSPGSHRVTAKVTFRGGSHTRARTFHVKAAGCRIPTPKFTG